MAITTRTSRPLWKTAPFTPNRDGWERAVVELFAADAEPETGAHVGTQGRVAYYFFVVPIQGIPNIRVSSDT